MAIPEMSFEQIIRLVAFTSLIIYSIYWHFSLQARKGRCYKINSKIISTREQLNRDREIYLIYTVEYEDLDGNILQSDVIPDKELWDSHKVGDKIEVNFDPKAPKKITNDDMDQIIFYIPFALTGGALVALAFLADEVFGIFK